MNGWVCVGVDVGVGVWVSVGVGVGVRQGPLGSCGWEQGLGLAHRMALWIARWFPCL